MTEGHNHLIDLLPSKDRRSLLGRCEVVGLTLEEILSEPETPTDHVYFPTAGYVSLVATVDGMPFLEVGMVGSEGMLGVQLALGVPLSPLHSLVQGAGPALRMTANAFRQELVRSKSLREILDRYLYVLMAQLASAAACVRLHQIDQRLARWVLMTRDRAGRDEFQMTHEFLGYMLGVRRVGITTAAGALRRRKLIQYQRGVLTVLDRHGLEGTACSCYAADRRTYDRVMHPQVRRVDRRK